MFTFDSLLARAAVQFLHRRGTQIIVSYRRDDHGRQNQRHTGRRESGGGGDGGPVGGAPSTSGLEDPDAAGAGLEALSLEAEQQSVFAEAGVSSDLLALRDAVEATLLAASGQFEALSDAPSTQGIVGVGIGLPDPDSIAFGVGGPGEPTLTLFTESALPREALLSQVGAKRRHPRALERAGAAGAGRRG